MAETSPRRSPPRPRPDRRSWRSPRPSRPAAAAGRGRPAAAGRGPARRRPTTPPVIVDGSSTVFRISKAAQEASPRSTPKVEVVVGNSGTGGGFGKYLQDEVDIVDASRPAKPEEEAKAKAQGIAWTRFLVGYDGITVVVNPKNDFVKELTVEQLKKLWSSPTARSRPGRTSTRPGPTARSSSTRPDDKSGTFEFFTEAIVGKAKSQRKDVQASSDDNILVSGVVGRRRRHRLLRLRLLQGERRDAPGRPDQEGRGRAGRRAEPARRSSTRRTPRSPGRSSST